MPLDPEVARMADQLGAVYREAWERITAEQERVLAGLQENPRLWRRRARLAELERAVARLMDDVDAFAREWVGRSIPRAYAAGARLTAEQTGDEFGWTQAHREAVAIHARDLFTDLLEATSFVRESTKAFVREVVGTAARLAPVTSQTAVQAAREAAALLRAQHGITSVVYANGARVGLDTYTQMAVRTKTAVAYNAGTLNHGYVNGVDYYEVFDGPSCGWTSHSDSDLANGKVVHVQEAARFPISHPQCARSFGPRPDVTRDRARTAEPTPGLGQADRTREARTEISRARAAQGYRPRRPTARDRVVQRRNARLVRRRIEQETRQTVNA